MKTSIKRTISNIKNNLTAISAFAGALVIVCFLIWAFSRHGTIGIFQVTNIIRYVFIALMVLGILLIAAAITYLYLRRKKQYSKTRILSIFIFVFSLPALIIPPVAFSALSGIFSPGFIDTPPQLLLTGDTGDYGIPDMAVYFTTEEATYHNTLLWGNENSTFTFTEDTKNKQHLFILSDLKPDTRYFYQVNGGAINYFSTPSADGQIRFAIAGDAHFGSVNSRNDLTSGMLEEIANPDNAFDMFFFMGDLVEYGFLGSNWKMALQAFSIATASIPTRFAAGNHDTLFSGLDNYLNYCSPQGLNSDSGSRLWYRIDTGKVHFLILDLEWNIESYTEAQAAWLEQQLKSIPEEDWTIVLSHGFYYASGHYSHGWNWYDNEYTINGITPLFNEYKVDLVCSGHVHNVQLLENSGVTYAVCGAFGGSPESKPSYVSAASFWHSQDKYAFIDVMIENEQCMLTFRNQDFEAIYTTTLDKNR